MTQATDGSGGLSLAKVPHVRSDRGEWIFAISLDAWGHVQLVDAEGVTYSNINIIPMFPLTAPERGISILDQEFEELLCIDSLSDLSEQASGLLKQELKLREFIPVIQRVISVSGKTEPCEWLVETNHGITRFVLNSEEDVHRVSNQAVNILDANGMRFRVEDLSALDRRSRAFIEWYV